ncbi:MAG: NAD(P)H-dependent glycerol-3-phosphate dehydrogenase [Clostridia bacterium]
MNKIKVSVLGCGRWGSFLAWYNSKIGNEVTIWGRAESKRFCALRQTRENEYVKFGEDINFCDDIAQAINFADVIIISIASQQLRGFIAGLDKRGLADKKVVLCMKGLEETSGKRLTEIAIEEGISKDNIAVWLGPGHIQEFVKGTPNCMIIDSYSRELTKYLVDIFKSNLIRFYYGNDIIGNEFGGATKNIIGIAAGMLDASGMTALKGPLMARGVREVARMIKALGGDENTAYGLAHLGDYETTLFSAFSQNKKFGENLINGVKSDKLAEGVMTTKAVLELAKKYDVEMPITQCVYNIIFKKSNPMTELDNLFNRELKNEKW